jgi:hypothetical protein
MRGSRMVLLYGSTQNKLPENNLGHKAVSVTLSTQSACSRCGKAELASRAGYGQSQLSSTRNGSRPERPHIALQDMGSPEP